MNFRYALIALPLLAASPVAAQDVVFAPGTGESAEAPYALEEYHDSDSANDVADIADRIDDPMMQRNVGETVEGLATSVMHLPVGRFVDAIERARPDTVDRRLPRDARVGDLAGRNADYLPQELGERSREAIAMMGGFARALAVMMPEFERMGRDMEDSFRAAKAQARD